MVDNTVNSRFPDTQSFIAIFLVVTIVVLAFLLAILGKSDTDLFKIMIGGLMTVGFASVITYYFGSSSGSKAKDDTMNAVVDRLTPTGSGPGGTGNGTTPKVVTTVPAEPGITPTVTTVTETSGEKK